MGYAFISYSTINQKQADALRTMLREYGVATWMASYDLTSGSNFPAEITKAVRECGCFVLLLSNASQESAAVATEVEMAVHTYKRPVIPIQTEELELNDAFRYYLQTIHIQRVYGIPEDAEGLAKILQEVARHTGRTAPAPQAPAKTAKAADDDPGQLTPREAYLLGREYFYKEGTRGNAMQAEKYLASSADRGYVHAQHLLGDFYYEGKSGKTDLQKAEKYYRLGVQQNDPCCKYNLALILEQKDPKAALALYGEAADQGNAQAMYLLGTYYLTGAFVEKQDLAVAAEFFRRAAELNYLPAVFRLALFTLDGIGGIPRDRDEGFRLTRLAADGGLAPAQLFWGQMLAAGDAGEKDPAEALRYFRMAAEQDYGPALSEVGRYYEQGKCGLRADPETAFKFYLRAAEKKDPMGLCRLGVCYEYGKGTDRDPKKAAECYRKAADRGYANAQYNLGLCYAGGIGVTENEEEAVRLFRLAAKQGNEHALGELKKRGLSV